MPKFNGKEYPLKTGMEIMFEKPRWTGSPTKGFKLAGSVVLCGTIVNDGEGSAAKHPTLTIQEINGTKHRIKAQHLYKTARILRLNKE